MRYSVPVKFFAILLTALSLVLVLGSAAGILQIVDFNFYTSDFEDWVQSRVDSRSYALAAALIEEYVIPLHTNCDDKILEEIGYGYYAYAHDFEYALDADSYTYTMYDEENQAVASKAGYIKDGYSSDFTYSASYPVLVTDPAATDTKYGTDYFYETTYYLNSVERAVTIRYYQSPAYSISLTVQPEKLMDLYGTSLTLVKLLYRMRYALLAILAASLVLFAMGAVYLCCAAGRSSRDTQVNPSGLNRLPLDLYLAGATGICLFLTIVIVDIAENWYYNGENFNVGTLAIVGTLLMCAACICIGFMCAFVSQFKLHNYYWLRHTLIGWCCIKLWQGLKFLLRFLGKLLNMLPVIWKWLLIAAGMGFVLLVSLLIAVNSYAPGLFIMVILGCVGIVLYGAYAFGTLLTGARRMAEGDLNTKISTKYLLGAYAQCAKHLNALADVAIVAAKKQTKSDRMKTELITNVSHDIKTPLTSIINYVDLLEKPHTPEEEQQYLEVLGRQSQRMKKLIEDLMEMSKATTGDMAVDISQVDAVEALNQALGEFADKLNASNLIPVFRYPENSVAIRADGRLTWRVLSNLLGNVVKYALPGTRVYIDLLQLDHQVLISLKNISREELNISADELTERFVRGDASRNTEGSGLGLNIAKSLMELQKGQLQLLVDGDLFKVTLVFPAA